MRGSNLNLCCIYGGVGSILCWLSQLITKTSLPFTLIAHLKDLNSKNNLKMAPSITENVTDVTEQVTEKIVPSSVKETKKEAAVEETAPAVQEPVVQQPAATTTAAFQHKKPLKLSGALDYFESFDVTPTIGREFVGVNLAKWLKAPNSDELIRDLAITSMTLLHLLQASNLTPSSSLPARSCFLPQARRH